MRMTGLGAFTKGEPVTYSQNGHREPTMIPAGSSYTASVPAAAAQPIVAPSIPTASTSSVAPTSSGAASAGVTPLAMPTTGITAAHLRPDAAVQAAAPARAAPTPIIKAGPGATGGAANAGSAVYGAGSSYYGAPEGIATGDAEAKKSGVSFLPIGLLLWAIFGS